MRALLRPPVPHFDPLGPLEGSTHTCQTPSVRTSVHTFTRTPWSLLETHTQTQERQRRPRHWGSTSTSGADWREGQWKHDQPIHFCSWVFFFWFFDIPFLYICIIQSFLPIKDFQWAFLSDSLPEMFFHHNKRLKEPEKREKSYAVWLQVFCRVSVLQCCRTLVSILERLFGRNATVFVDTLSFWAWRVQKEESDVHASVVLSSMELWQHRPVQFSPLLAFI